MKLTEIKIRYNSAIRIIEDYTILATPEEILELKNALKVVDKFKKNLNIEKDADFIMYDFNCDKNSVIITVDAGACG